MTCRSPSICSKYRSRPSTTSSRSSRRSPSAIPKPKTKMPSYSLMTASSDKWKPTALSTAFTVDAILEPNMAQRCKRFRFAGMAPLVALLLSAPAEPAAKSKLTIGYSSTGPTAVGLWSAQEIGAFNKYGVEGHFVFISSSPVMVPALIGGDVQCAIAGANAVIAAVLGGAPIVSVASLANRPYLRLWAQPEIARIDELRGKTLGVSRFGATTDNLTRILLRRTGMENA